MLTCQPCSMPPFAWWSFQKGVLGEGGFAGSFASSFGFKEELGLVHVDEWSRQAPALHVSSAAELCALFHVQFSSQVGARCLNTLRRPDHAAVRCASVRWWFLPRGTTLPALSELEPAQRAVLAHAALQTLPVGGDASVHPATGRRPDRAGPCGQRVHGGPKKKNWKEEHAHHHVVDEVPSCHA